MLVGHTHTDIDQTFSLISSRLQEEGAFSMPHLMRLASCGWSMHTSIGNPCKVHERLDHVLDFSMKGTAPCWQMMVLTTTRLLAGCTGSLVLAPTATLRGEFSNFLVVMDNTFAMPLA